MIKQKSTKQHYSANDSRIKRFGIFFVCFLMIMLLLGGIVFYQYRHNPIAFASVGRFTGHAQQWLTDRKHHLQASLHHRTDKIKTAVREPEKVNTVHFEFYSVLPNMQIDALVRPGQGHSVRSEEARSAVSKSSQHAANKPIPSSIDNLLFNQNDIDQDFAETVKHKKRG